MKLELGAATEAAGARSGVMEDAANAAAPPMNVLLVSVVLGFCMASLTKQVLSWLLRNCSCLFCELHDSAICCGNQVSSLIHNFVGCF